MSTKAQHSKQQADGLSRRRFLRALVGGTGAAALLPLLAACGSGSVQQALPTTAPTAAPAVGSAVNLVLMYNQNEFSDDELKLFTLANPEIAVERVEWTDDKQLQTMIAAGNPPDVFRTEGRFIPNLVSRQLVLDLSDYFKASAAIKPDDLAPPIHYYTYQGAIYGLAKDWSPDHSMYAHTAAFEEAGVPLPSTTTPLRYAEIAALADKLTKRDGQGTPRIGWTYENGWFVRTIQRILAEEEQQLYSADLTKIVIKDNPLAVEALKLFFDMSKENVTWNPLNPSPAWPGDDFTKGLVALVSYGYWFSGMITASPDAVVRDKVVMLPAPTWGGKKRINPSVSAAGTAISKATKYPDAAWKLFEFYSAGAPAETRARSGWGVPALKSLYPLMPRDSAFQQQVQNVLLDELKYADFILDINPYYEDTVFNTSWNGNLEQALRGDISFEQLVDRIESEVNTAITKGRAALGL